MARTKASVGAKVSSGKSSKARCNAAPPPGTTGPSGSGERSSRGPGGGGGNPVCPRETPKWQRPITNFFNNKDVPRRDSSGNSDDGASASTSKPKPKRNIIESDEEDAPQTPERPKNCVLDETLELEPLMGEDSHKIDEYYPKNAENGVTEKENGVTDKVNGVTDKLNGVTDKAELVTAKENVMNGEVSKGEWKGKGIGKKSNKENVDRNVKKRVSVKRVLEEDAVGEESDRDSKKVKIN